MKRKQARIIAAAAAVLIGLSGGGSALAECPDEVILEEAELLSAGQETTGQLPASGQGETEEPELLSETGTEEESVFAADDEAKLGGLLTEPGETGEFPEGESETSPEGIGETELLLAEEDESSDTTGNSRESETAEVSGTFETSDDLVVENITVVEDSAAQHTQMLASGTARNSFDESDFEYQVLPDGTVEVTDFTGEVTMTTSGVEIPETLGGKKVTRIGEKAFQDTIYLPWVIIPEGITSIGDYAFDGCYNLKEAPLPESLQTIGERAFAVCGFESIQIPAKVTSIGANVFYNCRHLKTVTFSPSSELKEIMDEAFSGTGLTEIHIPEGVTRIGDNAFSSSSKLLEVSLPESLQTIGDCAFIYCRQLESIVIPGKVTSIGSDAFLGCSELKTVTLSRASELKEIEDRTFTDCCELKSVDFPANLISIGGSAFSGCAKLEQIELPNQLKKIEPHVFKGCTALRRLTIPAFVESISYEAFAGCVALEVLTIPASMKSIQYNAFAECSLKQVYFEGASPWVQVRESEDEPINGLRSWFSGSETGDIYVMHEHWNSFSSIREEIIRREMLYGERPCINIKIRDSDTPHTWDSGTVSAPASCTEPGTIVYTCTVCQTTRTESLAASGAHTYGNYVTEQEATALAQGVRSRTCLVCGQKESEPTAKLEPTASVTAKNVALQVGQSTAKLKVTDLAPGDYVVSWKSSNPKVVKVSASGKITAKKKTGKATITVTLASGLEQKITVKVQKGEVKTSKISGVSKKLTLNKGKKKKLSPVVTPITSEQKITFSSSDSKVAAVNKKGVVSAKKKGKATITVRSGKKTVKCKVTVK